VAELPRQRLDEAPRLLGAVEREQLAEHAVQLGAPAQHDAAQPLRVLRERGSDRGGLEEQVDPLLPGAKDALGVQSAPPRAAAGVHGPSIGRRGAGIDGC